MVTPYTYTFSIKSEFTRPGTTAAPDLVSCILHSERNHRHVLWMSSMHCADISFEAYSLPLLLALASHSWKKVRTLLTCWSRSSRTDIMGTRQSRPEKMRTSTLVCSSNATMPVSRSPFPSSFVSRKAWYLCKNK